MDEEQKHSEILAKKSLWKVFLSWTINLAWLTLMLGIMIAYNLNPDNKIYEMLWYILWMGVLPIMLIWSYIILTKKGKQKNKNE